jgi:hypothetical protein
MSDVQREYLDDYLTGLKAKTDPDLDDDIFFERFCARQILKSRDIGVDDIAPGETRGEGDGGADSTYFFCDSKLVLDGMLPKDFDRHGVALQLVFIQATRSPNFDKDPIRKFEEMANDILDPAHVVDDHKKTYNPELREIIKRFRWFWTDFKKAAQAPELTITYYYASKGHHIDKTVQTRADQLETRVESLYPCKCKFVFVPAKRLRDLVHEKRQEPLKLEYFKDLGSAKLGDAYICLVPMHAYATFITTEQHEPREYLLEPNVRGYLGENKVNEKIQETLDGKRHDEFWWLNNGITIVANKIERKTDHLKLTRPRIVNGLQTSREIYNYARAHGWNISDDPRHVMVRAIEAASKELTNRIIKTTNSQTNIKSIYLHGTDEIQISLEDSFPAHGLFYERVKNQYYGIDNAETPTGQIVTFPYLMKALMAILLQSPDQARGRPDTFAEKEYKQLFPENRKPVVFANAAHLMLGVDAFLANYTPKIERRDLTNMRYYVAMIAGATLCNCSQPTSTQLGKLKREDMTDSVFKACLTVVQAEYQRLIKDKPKGQVEDNDPNKIAKGPLLADELKADLLKTLPPRFLTTKAKVDSK